ncbi:MAG: TetR/AcrR family transcriptional regulator [Dehalococcoidia bacterium]|nr:TetR/AcrR family transcriptional regulator [Dehalococcoidia bacterium]
MPKVSEAHIAARRQQILDAARACFARQGFHQTSIQDICKEAGLSPGAVYRYFPSKDHIIAATCSGCQEGIMEMIQVAKSQGLAPLETVGIIIDHGLDMMSSDAFLEFGMMNIQSWSEAMRSDEVREALLTAIFNTLGQAISDLIEQAQQDGECHDELSAKVVACAIMGTFHGLMLHKSLDSTLDIAACGKVMRAMFQGIYQKAADVA